MSSRFFFRPCRVSTCRIAVAFLALSALLPASGAAQSFRVSIGDAVLDLAMDGETRTVTVDAVLDAEVQRALSWRDYAHLGPRAVSALRLMADAMVEFQEAVDLTGEPTPDDLDRLLKALGPSLEDLGIPVPAEGSVMERLDQAFSGMGDLVPGGPMALTAVREQEAMETRRRADHGATTTPERLHLQPDRPLLRAREGLFDPNESWIPGREVAGPAYLTRYIARVDEGALRLETESEAAGRDEVAVPLPADLPSGPFLDGLFGLALLPLQDLATTEEGVLAFPVLDLEPDLRVEGATGQETRVEVTVTPRFGRLELRNPQPQTLLIGGGAEVPALRFHAIVSGEADPFMGLFPRRGDGEVALTLWVRADPPHAMLRIQDDDGVDVWGHLVGDSGASPEAWANWLAGGGRDR